VALLIFAVLLIPLWAGFDAPGVAMDEGMVLLYPELLLRGKLPYRDFETFYAPGNLWLLAGAYSIFGAHVDVERSVGLLYRLALLGGLFLVLRRWSLVAAAGGLFVAMMFLAASGLVAFAWFGGVAFALASVLLLAAKESVWRVPAAGLLAAAALLYRQDLAPAVLASAAPLLLRMPARERLKYFGALTLGLMPLAILAFSAGLQLTFENLFTYPVIISNPGRRLPLSFSPFQVQMMFYLHLLVCAVNLAAGAMLTWKGRGGVNGRLFLSVAFLGAGLTHQALQRADIVHVVLTAFFSLALLPTALLILSTSRGVARSHPAWAWGAAAFVLIAVLASAPILGTKLIKLTQHTVGVAPLAIEVAVRDRHFPYHGIALQTQEVLTYLEKHSRPQQRLFVGTSDLRRTFAGDTFIYHLLPWLTPATYFLELNPLSANRPGSRLASDVASADWLVLNQVWDDSGEPNLSRQAGSDAPNEVVRTQFELRKVALPYLVFQRKAARELQQSEL
jgi:hypothetical protein